VRNFDWLPFTPPPSGRFLRSFRCIGGSWLFVVTRSMAVTRIYRKDLPRVTASHNRLYLSLSKCIRHRLIAKINNKRRPWTCEALSRISVDYSCAHRAPMPIASPRHATQHNTTPRHVRPSEASERMRVFLPFSFPPHTYKCIESNPLFK
jgi:hypothetical protein